MEQGGFRRGQMLRGEACAALGRSCIPSSEEENISRCFALTLGRASVFSITRVTLSLRFLFSLPPLFCLPTRPCYTEVFFFFWERQTELNV